MSKPVLVFTVVLLTGAGCAGREQPQSSAPLPAEEAQPIEAPKEVQRGEDAGCKRAGCSRELCIEATAGFVATPCVWREHYRCYEEAECIRQVDGRCGWTQTEALRGCIENASRLK